MNQFVRRPASVLDPTKGVFCNDHFQLGYATNDIDRACEVFRQRYGIQEFLGMEGELPAGGYVRVEIAWCGGINYELITASGPGSEFYNILLPAEGFAIRHHHLGYFIHDESTWEALLKEIELGDWKIAFLQNVPDFLQACYIEAPELGHYLEYLFPAPAGIEFFESAPGN